MPGEPLLSDPPVSASLHPHSRAPLIPLRHRGQVVHGGTARLGYLAVTLIVALVNCIYMDRRNGGGVWRDGRVARRSSMCGAVMRCTHTICDGTRRGLGFCLL